MDREESAVIFPAEPVAGEVDAGTPVVVVLGGRDVAGVVVAGGAEAGAVVAGGAEAGSVVAGGAAAGSVVVV